MALRALHRIETLERELAARPRVEPVAIIGMGCRFPGADGLPALWDLLDRGGDATGPVPSTRWTIDDLAALGGRPAEVAAASRGGFIGDPEDFDPEFFGISPREAESLDPQQRLLLEVGWEALEDAGLPLNRLPREQTGVFVGVSGLDYALELAGDIGEPDPYLTTGSAHSVASGRLAYVFGFGGPAVSIDTACSSSAVALHMARRSLLAGDCDIAVVGGVNRLLLPHISLQFARANMLSPTGRCRAFSSQADGFARSEGCGVLVLKRAADAARDADRIYAAIVGAAVNQDGRTSGLTAPNGKAQERVIASALADAGVSPEAIGYVEAHGTGTRLGDPIELRALARIHDGRSVGKLPVGSIKANLGHLEAAAGVAGVIKTALMLHHGRLLPHTGGGEPTEGFDWGAGPLAIAAQSEAWPASLPRRAGVSAFGFSGTNVHLVLTGEVMTAAATASPRPELVVISARSTERLHAWLPAWRAAVEATPSLADFAFTAAHRRSHEAQRAYAVALPGREPLFRNEPVFKTSREVDALELSPAALARWPGLKAALDAARGADQPARQALADFLLALGAPAPQATAPSRALVVDEIEILERVGQAYLSGATIDWGLLMPQGGAVVSLPSTVFIRRPLLRRRWAPGKTRPAAVDLGPVSPLRLAPVTLAPAPAPREGVTAARLIRGPTTLAEAADLVAGLSEQTQDRTAFLPSPASGMESELVDAFLRSAARVIRLERLDAKAAWLDEASADLAPTPSALGHLVEQAAQWRGGAMDVIGGMFAPAPIAPIEGGALVICDGPVGRVLAAGLLEAYDQVAVRGWSEDVLPAARRVYAVLPRAERREIITPAAAGRLAESFRRQAETISKTLGRLSAGTEICLIRGLEGAFGWPGRLVDTALGDYAWTRIASGGGASCLDWSGLRRGDESSDELERLAAHGFQEGHEQDLPRAALGAAALGGRFVAYRDSLGVRPGMGLDAIASGFRLNAEPTARAGAPRQRLLRIVGEALGHAGPDLTCSLLDLGADSLIALEIAKRVQSELRVDLDIGDLLSDRSLEQLIRAVESPPSVGALEEGDEALVAHDL